jgi:hypothetical protein
MSSVLASFAQTPSRTIWSEDGAYIHTFADFQSAFASYTPVNNGNIFLFANDDDLGNAVKDLENNTGNSTDSHVSLLDMGKKVYLGVVGGNSIVFTYNLVRVESGSYRGEVYYVLTGQNGISDATYSALDGYGEVYVGRGAA